MQNFHETFCCSCLARVHLRVLAQNMIANLAVNDFNEQAVDSPAARRYLLQNTRTVFFILDGRANALELSLKSINPRQELLFFFRCVGHTKVLLDMLYPV